MGQVDNNVWIVGDDAEAIVIDAAHDAEAMARALGDRVLRAIVCTHAPTTTWERPRNSPPGPGHRSCSTRTTTSCGSRLSNAGNPRWSQIRTRPGP
ncbi:hypothetical protein GCM10010304_04690 [Streptomyces roseoviolaceus]